MAGELLTLAQTIVLNIILLDIFVPRFGSYGDDIALCSRGFWWSLTGTPFGGQTIPPAATFEDRFGACYFMRDGEVD